MKIKVVTHQLLNLGRTKMSTAANSGLKRQLELAVTTTGMHATMLTANTPSQQRFFLTCNYKMDPWVLRITLDLSARVFVAKLSLGGGRNCWVDGLCKVVHVVVVFACLLCIGSI